jgi:ABC-type glycerol-3-phosphate transport system permease component
MAATPSVVADERVLIGERTRRASWRLSTAALFVVLSILAIIFEFPIYWTIASSLKSPPEIINFPPLLYPAVPQWENYVRVFTKEPFALWIFNTVFVVVSATLGAVLSSSLVAYSFARFRYRGRDLIFLVTLATLMLPAQVTLIPQYIIWSRLGFVNTLFPLWLPQWFGGGAFNIFLLRQFILSLPRELDEAALIDGASRFNIFRTIILPLCVPALATVVIIEFLSDWSDYLTPLIYLNSETQYTLSLGLSLFRNYPETGGLPQQHLLMAASVMTALPPVILFFAAQRYFVRGIVLSGIKG